MYFSIALCDDTAYQEAKWYFLQQWRSDLLSREPSSLIGAYLVTQQMFKLWKTWFSFISGVHSYEEMYFSTSHSEDIIAVTVDSKKVAVDLEYVRPRDESLLQNVHVPDSPYLPWENFYLQRCAKECLVKYLDLTSSEMQEMVAKAFIANHHFVVEGWEFNSLIILQYRWKEIPIHINIKDGVVIAFLHQDNFKDNYNYMDI